VLIIRTTLVLWTLLFPLYIATSLVACHIKSGHVAVRGKG